MLRISTNQQHPHQLGASVFIRQSFEGADRDIEGYLPRALFGEADYLLDLLRLV